MALGAGAVALATSYYYFFGPLGKMHRKRAQKYSYASKSGK